MTARVKLNLQGFRALRRSPAVVADLRARAERVAAAAGPGFAAEESPSVNRARFTVAPVTFEAALENARHQTLVRALNAGR